VVEHQIPNLEAAGSNPAGVTTKLLERQAAKSSPVNFFADPRISAFGVKADVVELASDFAF
jgi:hypothetical protein